MRLKSLSAIVLAFVLPWIFLGTVSPRGIYDAALNAAWRLAGFRLERVDAGGSTIAYLDGGTGPPLVIVPGFGDDSRTWLEVARHLRKHHRVVIPDPPGFGRSPPDVDAGYTFPEQVERLARFLDQLGLDQAALMGESMGGGVVALFAAEHPQRVSWLGLLCPAGMKPETLSPFWQEVARGTNLLIPRTDRELEASMRAVMAHPPHLPAFARARLLAEIAKEAPLRERLFREIRGGGDFQIQAHLPRISAPTIVLWGEQDLVLDSSAAPAVARDLPTARLTMLPGCGHTLHLDCPDRVVQNVLAHGRTHRTDPAPAGSP